MADLKKLAEEIVGLTLLEAQELKTILKDEYGIEPAAGGAVMVAGAAGDAGGARAAPARGVARHGVGSFWQPPRAGGIGDQPDPREGEQEAGRTRRDGDVGGHRQAGAGACGRGSTASCAAGCS